MMTHGDRQELLGQRHGVPHRRVRRQEARELGRLLGHQGVQGQPRPPGPRRRPARTGVRPPRRRRAPGQAVPPRCGARLQVPRQHQGFRPQVLGHRCPARRAAGPPGGRRHQRLARSSRRPDQGRLSRSPTSGTAPAGRATASASPRGPRTSTPPTSSSTSRCVPTSRPPTPRSTRWPRWCPPPTRSSPRPRPANLASSPKHLKSGFDLDVEWWIKNEAAVSKRWQEWVNA